MMNPKKSLFSASDPGVSISSANIFRVVGYGLFILAIVNFLDIVLPLQLMNAQWELETAGAILESIPIPLLSLILILYGEAQQRGKLEKIFLKVLSYTCLLSALLFLLLIIVVTSNTVRVQRQVTTQSGDAVSQQLDQITQLETQLQQASDQQVAAFLENEGVALAPGESEEARQRLLQSLSETKTQIRQERSTVSNNQQRALFKNAVKWNLTAVIASFIFFYFWRSTHWARMFRWRSGSQRGNSNSSLPKKTPSPLK
ncbi:MAG: HpsJ family protein [Elainella sp. Prado103]|nr:HpsJ family protein [Elainella sp. Prado103]